MLRGRRLGWLAGLCTACAGAPQGELPMTPDAGLLADATATLDAAVDVDGGERDAAVIADAGRPAELAMPAVVSIPYVVAGQGGSVAEVEIENLGDEAIDPLLLTLASASFALLDAPSSLPGRGRATFGVRWAGAASESIDRTTLTAGAVPIGKTAAVYAVAGDPALGVGAWQELRVAQDLLAGEGLTLGMPTAPFPSAGAPYTDDRVRIFVPEGYRDLGAHTLVLHFHGFSTTLASTLAAHRYQEQVYASGANAVLVVPQGPVNAQSGNFGKLMDPGATKRLLDEVLIALYRDGRITQPVLGEVVISAHSGGYQAVAANLDPLLPVRQIDLYDSIYGYQSTFEGFVTGGGRLRSNYTSGGGTLDDNQAVAAALTASGISVASSPSQRSLKDAAAMITYADSTHDGSTRIGGAYGEWLRFGAAHGRRGPRLELRSAIDDGTTTTLRWISPSDDLVTGFIVERSSDGVDWVTAARADGEMATIASSGGGRVRVRAEVAGVDTLASDVYRVDPAAQILVVDHFDRTLGGGYAGLAHDFAAIVGESAGPVATIAHRSIEEDGFDLTPYPLVIWALGDQSTEDRTFTTAEQSAVADYLDGGGRLIVSGSEVGYDLVAQGHGSAFFGSLGASYVADDSQSATVDGAGPLASLPSFTFGGSGSPYPVGYPDVLGAPSGSVVLLRYGDGRAAAVGVPDRTVVVGFPLETIDRAEDRAALCAALRAFLGR